jgi:hypothetical protein
MECFICDDKILNGGNSGRPFDGICCDSCNKDVILPLRIMRNGGMKDEFLEIVEMILKNKRNAKLR